MRYIAYSLLLAVTAATIISSCKKDDEDKRSERAKMITGTWKSTEVGADSNGNGAWDASEHRPAAGTDEAVTLTFNADGTGTSKFDDFPASFAITWNLQNNDNDLRLISNVLGPDTTITNILSLTSSDAVVRDASEQPAKYLALKKQ